MSVWPMSMDVSFFTLQAALPGGHWDVLSPVPVTMKVKCDNDLWPQGHQLSSSSFSASKLRFYLKFMHLFLLNLSWELIWVISIYMMKKVGYSMLHVFRYHYTSQLTNTLRSKIVIFFSLNFQITPYLFQYNNIIILQMVDFDWSIWLPVRLNKKISVWNLISSQ